MVIYRGPSVLDGKPIIAIATFKTENDKTGDMIQTWIMREDIAPHHATKTGDDSSVCGNCPLRHYNNGACYVQTYQAPLAVFNKYHGKGYPEFNAAAFAGRRVRLGAYGDPAAVPAHVWEAITAVSAGHTGYTHQALHRNFDPAIAQLCQVSVETPKQARAAHAKGWRTFRVAGDASKRLPGEIECLSDSEGKSCHDCLLCDGKSKNIAITIHGSRAGKAKTHDVIARAA